jgi:diguanylate cyclase (GGDEF)-like protein/PAS domain S-box-containing protein
MISKFISKQQMIDSIKSSNSLEKMLIDNTDEALFFYSLDSELIYVNPAFETITGYSVEELYENNFIPFVHPEDHERMMKLWEGLYRGEFFEEVEFRIIKKCGEIRWNLSTWKLVYDSSGEKIGIQGKQQDITKRKQAEINLEKAMLASEKIANTDELTGLNTRRAFFIQGKRIFSQGIRFNHTVSVIMMDLDNFKKINDAYGHCAGDNALRAIANIIKHTVREIDVVGRIGGEEFAIVLPETSIEEAVNLAERLREKIAAAEVDNGKQRFQLTASFGICSSQASDFTLENTLIKADDALYLAKNNGRNQVKTCE